MVHPGRQVRHGRKALPAPSARPVAARLLDPRRRVKATSLSRLDGLELPGLYAWYVDSGGARDLTRGLGHTVAPGLIYAGQTGAGERLATLRSRVLGNHLRGNTRGSTFRFTLACVLRDQLSLVLVGRRRIERDGERRLSDWMHDHLEVAVEPVGDRWSIDALEAAVLIELDPPLNLRNMPSSSIRSRLSTLRSDLNREHGPWVDAPALRRTPTSSSIRVENGPSPEELARELGLSDATRVRAFLRREFPRRPEQLWSRWGPLPPDQVAAVRGRFGKRR